MPANLKASNEEVLAAYQATGTVWGAAKRLGMCGQSVWERLKRLGATLSAERWSDEEKADLVKLAEQGYSIHQIAKQLGRPYSGVAGILSALDVRIVRKHARKTRREIFITQENASAWRQGIEQSGLPASRYARANALDLDTVVAALQRHEAEYWLRYTRERAVGPVKQCPNCQVEFYPLAHKQRTCSRRCQAHHRADRAYFGGKRNQTVGLAEGVCQLCLEPRSALSSHHVLGKENDPENEYLVALCGACHQVVGWLSAKGFTDTSRGWERLIHLVASRRLTDNNKRNQTQYSGIGFSVELEHLTDEDLEAYGEEAIQ